MIVRTQKSSLFFPYIFRIPQSAIAPTVQGSSPKSKVQSPESKVQSLKSKVDNPHSTIRIPQFFLCCPSLYSAFHIPQSPIRRPLLAKWLTIWTLGRTATEE